MAVELQAEVGIAPRLYCNRLLDLPEHIPAADRHDPAHDFVAQMRRIDRRQRSGLAALKKLGECRQGPVQHLPLIPSVAAQGLLERLADVLQAGEGANP